MATDRDALAGRFQVGFGRNGVLVVAEVVANIGQYLYQRDANIWDVALLPIRHDEGQPIKDKLTEAGIVLREIIDLRFNQSPWWAGVYRLTIEVARTVGLEGEIYTRIAWIETLERLIGRWVRFVHLNQAQRIDGEIARLINRDLHAIGQVRVIRVAQSHFNDLDIANALSPSDAHVFFSDIFRRFVHETNVQYALVRFIDLYIVDTVQVRIAILIFMIPDSAASFCIVLADLGSFHSFTPSA